MKYLKYGFYSIVKMPLFNILIMLELAAILVVGNMTIAAANSRSVFYDPYKEIMNHEGYIYTARHGADADKGLEVKKMLDSLKGDIGYTYNYYAQLKTDNEIFQDEFVHYDELYRNFFAFDDGVWSQFNLPLESGRWAGSQLNEKGQIEAVVLKNKESKIQLGDVYDFELPITHIKEDGKIDMTFEKLPPVVVTGIIGNGQYYPRVTLDPTNTSVMGTYSFDTLSSNDAQFFVSANAEKRLCDDRTLSISSAYIYYNSPPTDEIRKQNDQIISSAGKGTISKMSEFKAGSDAYLYEQYIKMLPILLCVFIIVVTELICSVAMNTNSQMRNYGIYYLCGCRWMDCLKISLSYSLILVAGGAAIGSAVFLLFRQSSYSAMFEQNIDVNNIWITLIIFAFTFLISLIIPFFLVSRTSPVSIIKEN